MADKKKMSVEDILAACRQADAGENTGSPPSSETVEANPEDTGKPDVASSAPAKKPTDMSTADILAAARSGKAGGSKEVSKGDASPGSSGAAKPSAGKPAKPPGEMSIADILAAARGEKSGSAKAAPVPKAAPAKKAAAPEKASPKAAASAAPEALDTSSILAAARKPTKRGPMSKAEAAAKSAATTSPKPAKKPVPAMPEKPAYAKPKVVERPAADDRRGFLTVLVGSFLAVGFTSMSAVFGLWTLGFARFMFPNILTEPPNQFKVGFPADFAPGTVTTKFKAQFGVWIVNAEYDGQPQIAALRTVCTHLGCTPNWLEAEQKFKCPCHGSGFYKDGINFEGPAPRPLERYAIRIADDGQLEVDKSRLFQEEMGQWRDPASFVPV